MKTAVILAAGQGTRMGSLTEGVPKPMLRVSGRPLLEHILDRMREAGMERAAIVTGYHAEQIEQHFTNYPLELRFIRQESPDGTGSAAGLAREFVEPGDFLLSHGDILAGPSEYRAMAELFDRRPATQAVLGVRHVEDPCQGAAVYVEESLITRIVEKPPRGTSTTNWNSAGLYAFRSTLFPYLAGLKRSERGEYELTTAIQQMIADGLPLRIHSVEGIWMDVGRPGDLEAAGKLVQRSAESPHSRVRCSPQQT